MDTNKFMAILSICVLSCIMGATVLTFCILYDVLAFMLSMSELCLALYIGFTIGFIFFKKE